ncbi:hypothetical protein AZF37_07200 [endosymbiont 'TC1' of Trimyema compressum]|uniref:hypothetical protein n=1 Tax=endosymbiont 'TC1' of Trimyema compressum TaxID=243899 RepID=UPI0007F13F29|nr:hypothetical protein [endosymbiont 'TC1' of Trimyema compressum]AMP20975.1 hypothetical protein AZF37_07200 [endosymbiont 'TC1' of Trimyema compressum]
MKSKTISVSKKAIIIRILLITILLTSLSLIQNSFLKAEDVTITNGQVTFAQQFPNSHTAEVVANQFGKTVNDLMDSNVLNTTFCDFNSQGLTDITGIDILTNLQSFSNFYNSAYNFYRQALNLFITIKDWFKINYVQWNGCNTSFIYFNFLNSPFITINYCNVVR